MDEENVSLSRTIENSPSYVAGMSEEELRRKYSVAEIAKMGSNESPLGPSPRAVEAMQQAISSLHRYPPMDDGTLRQALSDTIGHDITPDHLVTGNGGCDILSMIADGFLDDTTGCVICRPTFPVYEFTAKRNGAAVVYADLTEPGFEFDVDAILNAVTENTRLLYLCSPNNPTGTLLSNNDLDRVLKGLPEKTLIVFDEVYHHFVTAGDTPDLLAHVLNDRRIIVVHSFSKAYGLAGCRLGYGIARPDLVAEIRRHRLPFHINNVTMEGGLAALEDKEHLAQTVSTVVEGRSWLIEGLSQAGIDTWPTQGNFVLFRTGAPAAEVADRLLRQGIIVRPMDTFYLPDHLRVSVGRRSDNERFLDSLRLALTELAE